MSPREASPSRSTDGQPHCSCECSLPRDVSASRTIVTGEGISSTHVKRVTLAPPDVVVLHHAMVAAGALPLCYGAEFAFSWLRDQRRRKRQPTPSQRHTSFNSQRSQRHCGSTQGISVASAKGPRQDGAQKKQRARWLEASLPIGTHPTAAPQAAAVGRVRYRQE